MRLKRLCIERLKVIAENDIIQNDLCDLPYIEQRLCYT